jgi:hypothetical protein
MTDESSTVHVPMAQFADRIRRAVKASGGKLITIAGPDNRQEGDDFFAAWKKSKGVK